MKDTFYLLNGVGSFIAITDNVRLSGGGVFGLVKNIYSNHFDI